MNSRWQWRTYDELLRALGPPRQVLNVPGGGNPPSFVVVYGVDKNTGCVDAFAVQIETPAFVRNYFCR